MITRPTPLDVVVIGVANADIITRVPRLPNEGETVFGDGLSVLPGGKGLNQAIAVAQGGGRAALVTRAGNDEWGQLLFAALHDAGVDTSAVTLVPDGATAGVLIQVPPSGDSAVTVTRTQTTLPGLADIEAARPLLDRAAATVIQLELDPAVVARAMTFAKGRKIGMLAPVHPMPGSVLADLDVIVVNVAEAARLLGTLSPADEDDATEVADALRRLGPRAAVVTLGAKGAAYADQSSTQFVPAPPTRAVDTTGAGDAFLGAFTLSLVRGVRFSDAVSAGLSAGSSAVKRFGATDTPNNL